MSRCAALDDAIVEERPRPLEQLRRHAHALTPRRIAAVIAVVVLAVRLRRHFRYARNVVRYRRQLRLALSLLLFLRQLRKT
jgi:hypothetical protein